MNATEKTAFSLVIVAGALTWGHFHPDFATTGQDVFKLFLGYWFGKIIGANGHSNGKELKV